MKQLRGLAASSGEADACSEGRGVAGRWLFALMLDCADHPQPATGSDRARLKQQVERVLESLAKDDTWTTRLAYLDTAEKYLFLLQAREGARDASDGAEGVRGVAEQVWRYMQVLLLRREGPPEGHPGVLLRMFHITCDVLCPLRSDASSPLSLPLSPSPHHPCDTDADMLHAGALEIRPGPLLKYVVLLFANIFVCLSPDVSGDGGGNGAEPPYVHSTRVALLSVLCASAQRDRSVVDELGGLRRGEFWRRCLDDRSPPVCLAAAVFLCGHVAAHQKAAWCLALHRLRDAAADGDAALQSPLLLARAALRCVDEQQHDGGDGDADGGGAGGHAAHQNPVEWVPRGGAGSPRGQLKFDDVVEGTVVQMCPEGCAPDERFDGVLMTKNNSFVTVRWSIPHGGRMPYGIVQEQQITRDYFDRDGKPTAFRADAG